MTRSTIRLSTVALLAACLAAWATSGCGDDSTGDCGPGMVADGDDCVDEDGCADNPCDDGGDTAATCADVAAPDTGYSCTCSNGYEDDGTTCVETGVDPCEDTPCDEGGDSGATCVADTPPDTGYSCMCTTGYEDDGTACTDIDGCADNPCDELGDTSATCTDVAAPGTGYDCTCTAGYTEDATACVDEDGCVGNPCTALGDTDATCIDAVAPDTGYDCTCTAGYTEDATTCADEDGCAGNPCDDAGDAVAVCVDAAPPSTGYGCTCSAGRFFDGTACLCNAAPAAYISNRSNTTSDWLFGSGDAECGSGYFLLALATCTANCPSSPAPLYLYNIGGTSVSQMGGSRASVDALAQASLPGNLPTTGTTVYEAHAFISFSGDAILDFPVTFGLATNVPIYGINGAGTLTQLASNWADFMDGTIAATIGTALGYQDFNYFWTGSNVNGTASGVDCDGWVAYVPPVLYLFDAGPTTVAQMGGGTRAALDAQVTANLPTNLPGMPGAQYRAHAFIGQTGDALADLPSHLCFPATEEIRGIDGSGSTPWLAGHWAALMTNNLSNAIGPSLGFTSTESFWTGSANDGTASGVDCSGWTASTGNDAGISNQASATTDWLQGSAPGDCAGSYRLLGVAICDTNCP